MRLRLRLIRKSRKAFDTATIARLLRHEDEHGMGHVFMYAFVNEVVRMKTPFPFDCESAQVLENDGGLLVVDKVGRSIALEHTCQRLCLSLDDKRTEGVKQIKYKGTSYREVVLAWLTACIRYTSLQPELREELMQYVQSIKRTTISESKKSNMQNLHNSGGRKICESHFWRRKAMCKFCTLLVSANFAHTTFRNKNPS